MPRNASGTYTAPSNSWNPPVTGTVIDPDDWIETQDDYVDALTNSLSRTGDGGMQADLELDAHSILAAEISTPAAPAANSLKLYAVDVATVTKLAYIDSASTQTIIGGGDVVGPASSTDNAVARFDSTTGKLIQNSAFIVDDTGNVSGFGGQLAFPAVQNPSANVNTLDDYEEGTWTPVFTFATPGNQSIAYSTQFGSYTKIGRVVTLMCNITLSTFTHTTASGNANITGLPFAAANTTNQTGCAAIGYQGITKAGYTTVTARVAANTSLVEFVATGSGVSQSFVAFTDMPTGGVPVFTFVMQYFSA